VLPGYGSMLNAIAPDPQHAQRPRPKGTKQLRQSREDRLNCAIYGSLFVMTIGMESQIIVDLGETTVAAAAVAPPVAVGTGALFAGTITGSVMLDMRLAPGVQDVCGL
jgi:hypothetical protein